MRQALVAVRMPHSTPGGSSRQVSRCRKRAESSAMTAHAREGSQVCWDLGQQGDSSG